MHRIGIRASNIQKEYCQGVTLKGDNMKTFFEIAFEVLGCAVLVIGMITIFAGAVLQESYRNYPPTAEEIAENPELVRYAK